MNDRIINNNRLVEKYLYALRSLLYATVVLKNHNISYDVEAYNKYRRDIESKMEQISKDTQNIINEYDHDFQ